MGSSAISEGGARVRLAKRAKVFLRSPVAACAKRGQACGGRARQRWRQRHGRSAGSLHGVAHARGAGRCTKSLTWLEAATRTDVGRATVRLLLTGAGKTSASCAPPPINGCPELKSCPLLGWQKLSSSFTLFNERVEEAPCSMHSARLALPQAAALPLRQRCRSAKRAALRAAQPTRAEFDDSPKVRG